MSSHRPMMYGVLTHLYTKGNILMVKKAEKRGDPNSGFYTPAGGKLEDDERGLDLEGRLNAAIRETEQETGITPISPKLKGTILFDNYGRIFDNWPNAPDYFVYIFTASEYSGELKTTGDELETPFWISESDIDGLPKSPGDKKMYEWLRDGRNFHGVIRHKGKELDEANTWVDYF